MQFYDSLEKLSFQYYAVITYRMLSLMATAYTTDINMDVANYFHDKGALKKEPFTKEKNMAHWKYNQHGAIKINNESLCTCSPIHPTQVKG